MHKERLQHVNIRKVVRVWFHIYIYMNNVQSLSNQYVNCNYLRYIGIQLHA